MRNCLPGWVWAGQKTSSAKLTTDRRLFGSTQYPMGAGTIMMFLRITLAAMLIMAFSAPADSDQASSAYARGARAEADNQYDAAYTAYNEAYQLKPKDPKYMVAYLRTRSIAA